MGLHYKSIYIVLSQLGTLSTLGPDKKNKTAEVKVVRVFVKKSCYYRLYTS